MKFIRLTRPVYCDIFTPGVKQPERDAGHSPPFSAEFMNLWSYTSAPLYVFITWCL